MPGFRRVRHLASRILRIHRRTERQSTQLDEKTPNPIHSLRPRVRRISASKRSFTPRLRRDSTMVPAMATTLSVFFLAAALEIGGCFCFWHWLRNGASPAWAALGVVLLAGFGWSLTRADSDFAGRAYAAYGGVYITGALLWLWVAEKQRPDFWDTLGAGICIAGALVILFGPRG